ncbi:hypothetical protein [Cytobacillus gottheilii]|uniref:hypothetical protein n=1 Tax=Cytobacillus gottheilii TaxID=859144 RepID=UPI0009BC1088|nr:hypothetical protein [Cytobacillus gottheilii]
MNTYYAGIGSRETPKEILEYFARVAAYLATKGFTLRSGGAEGADKVFEIGCDKVNGEKEIYLPWKGFEKSTSNLIVWKPKAFEIAEEFHPNWERLSQGARKLQARNTHQVLGNDLETPSKFIICWTKNGKGQGGTGQALRMARHYEIPIFDAGSFASIDEIKISLKEFLLSNEFLSEEDIDK